MVRPFSNSVRHCRRAASAFAAICFVALFASAPGSAAVFSPKSFELDNGLRVVVIENRRAPVVMQMVWYRVGAAKENLIRDGRRNFFNRWHI